MVLRSYATLAKAITAFLDVYRCRIVRQFEFVNKVNKVNKVNEINDDYPYLRNL